MKLTPAELLRFAELWGVMQVRGRRASRLLDNYKVRQRRKRERLRAKRSNK